MGTRNFIPPEIYAELNWFFRDPGWVILYSVFFAVFLFFWVRPFWRLYRSVPGGRTFQFHISDYWAALAGLIPTFILAADAMNVPQAPMLLSACVVGASQLAGLFIGRVHNVLPPRAEPKGQWEESGWFFLGALFGLLLVGLSVVVFTLGLLMAAFSIIWAPPLLVFFLIYRFMKRL